VKMRAWSAILRRNIATRLNELVTIERLNDANDRFHVTRRWRKVVVLTRWRRKFERAGGNDGASVGGDLALQRSLLP
jgi:hypothetical protein